MSTISEISVRVYGLLLNEHDQLLVSDEHIRGMNFVKLPGGGLEIGEGPAQTVRREFEEETGFRVEVVQHWYTTDFFIESVFKTGTQVLCIYYQVRWLDSEKANTQLRTSHQKFDYPTGSDQSFRWVAISDLEIGEFALTSDRLAVEKLIHNLQKLK